MLPNMSVPRLLLSRLLASSAARASHRYERGKYLCSCWSLHEAPRVNLRNAASDTMAPHPPCASLSCWCRLLQKFQTCTACSEPATRRERRRCLWPDTPPDLRCCAPVAICVACLDAGRFMVSTEQGHSQTRNAHTRSRERTRCSPTHHSHMHFSKSVGSRALLSVPIFC